MNSIINEESSPVLQTIMQTIVEKIGTGKVISYFEDDQAEFILRWEGRSVNNELLRFERKWSYKTMYSMYDQFIIAYEFVESFNKFIKSSEIELV